MPIGDFDDDGFLEPGEHEATWNDIEDRFGEGPKRQLLLEGLDVVVQELRGRGVDEIWIDGSFVTDKPRPSDVDVVYKRPPRADILTWGLYSPVQRDQLKQKHGVHLFPYPSNQIVSGGILSIIEWFSRTEDGHPKGIVKLVPERVDSDESQE